MAHLLNRKGQALLGVSLRLRPLSWSSSTFHYKQALTTLEPQPVLYLEIQEPLWEPLAVPAINMFSGWPWSVDYDEKLKPYSQYMGASWVVFTVIIGLCLLLASTHIQRPDRRREGMDTGGPDTAKLIQINTHNVSYLQGVVADMKKTYDYMMDVSGQAHDNMEGLKRVANRSNDARDQALHGAPPKKLAGTPGAAEEQSVRPPS